VSSSGYYHWKRVFSKRTLEEAQIAQRVKKAFRDSRDAYGSPRVYRKLKQDGLKVSKKRVEKTMRTLGLRARKRRKYRPTTLSKHREILSQNLVARKFDRGVKGKVWLADITYLKVGNTWGYLAVVLDGHTRKVVGWSLENHMRSSLVLSALRKAYARERPKEGFLLHSDRGSQYASKDYRDFIATIKAQQSMSRKGNCWDNAPMESFFDSLKCEYTHHESFQTLEDARRGLFWWIEAFYNRQRLHSSLGYKSPACFEEKTMTDIA
jgi:putative transposase